MSTLTRSKSRSRINRDGTVVGDAIIYFIMALVIFLTVYPVYYVIILSISDPIQAATLRVYTVPKGLYFGAYEIIARNPALWRSYAYTIFYVVAQTSLTLLTSVLIGYVLTVKGLIGRKFLVYFILVPMYFGGGLIPTFILISRLGLLNTVWALVLPGSYSIWYMILVRSYFASLDEGLRESARIDGASHFTILFRIYLPLSKPILAVVAIYTIVGVWNSWFTSSVYQTDQTIQPLQMYLRRVLITQEVDMTSGFSMAEAEAIARQRLTNNQLKYAMISFTTIPVLLVYPFFQKYFVKGVMLGSLKG